MPTGQMFFIRDLNGKIWEVNTQAVKRLPYKLALYGTKKILDAYKNESFIGKFIYGDLRSGKSVYALHLLAEVYGETWEEKNIMYNINDEYALPVFLCKKKNWLAFKKYMVFLPEEFEKAHERVVEEGLETGKREKLLVWDDAGVWLNKREYHEGWTKELIKQLQIVGTAFSSIVFTSPNHNELLKGIREIPGFRWGAPSKPVSEQVDKYLRSIKLYSTKTLGSKKWYKLEYQDRYGKVDQEAFESYQALRRRYLNYLHDGESQIKERKLDLEEELGKAEIILQKKRGPKRDRINELDPNDWKRAWRKIYKDVDLNALQ